MNRAFSSDLQNLGERTRPGRGWSANPSGRRSENRLRHLVTVGRETDSRSAICPSDPAPGPARAATRNASACAVFAATTPPTGRVHHRTRTPLGVPRPRTSTECFWVVAGEVGDAAGRTPHDVLEVGGSEVAPSGRMGLRVLNHHGGDPLGRAASEQRRVGGVIGHRDVADLAAYSASHLMRCLC